MKWLSPCRSRNSNVIWGHFVTLGAIVLTNVGMVSIHIVNSKNGSKEPIRGYKSCDICQTLICGGYVKVRESFFTQLFYLRHSVLLHFVIWVSFLNYEGSCMDHRPRWYRKQKNMLSNIRTLMVSTNPKLHDRAWMIRGK